MGLSLREFGKKLDSLAGMLPAEDHARDVAARVKGSTQGRAPQDRIRKRRFHFAVIPVAVASDLPWRQWVARRAFRPTYLF